MIDEDLAREAIALLGTAAALLIEVARDQPGTRPVDATGAAALGVKLDRLEDDHSRVAVAAGAHVAMPERASSV